MTAQPGAAASRGPGRVRAGDEDRARAASLLGDHYADGRLDGAELDERTSQALAAVYTDELDALFVDLPGAPVPAPARRPNRSSAAAVPRAPQRGSFVPVLLVAAVLLVVLTRGAALWLLFPLWWFAGPALLGRRHRRWNGPDRSGRTPLPLATPRGKPIAVGAGPRCGRWTS